MNDMTQNGTASASLTGVETGAGMNTDDALNQVAGESAQAYAGCPACTTPYTVQRGDSFYLIARKFGIDVRALLNANPNIAPGSLLIGDVLCVPAGGAASGPACPAGSTPYIVQSGQTLTDVLVQNNISVRSLRETNEGVRLTALAAGDRLCIPQSGMRGACEDGGQAYEVQAGDTLAGIAQANGTTPDVLMRLNPNLLPTDFRQGQVICLPTRLRTIDAQEAGEEAE